MGLCNTGLNTAIAEYYKFINKTFLLQSRPQVQ
jgi:hypothetical protein